MNIHQIISHLEAVFENHQVLDQDQADAIVLAIGSLQGDNAVVQAAYRFVDAVLNTHRAAINLNSSRAKNAPYNLWSQCAETDAKCHVELCESERRLVNIVRKQRGDEQRNNTNEPNP